MSEEIAYVGIAGVTQSCLEAIRRLIQYGDTIARARLLTHSNHHAFLMESEEEEDVVIRAGFTSGYPGEGPAGLAEALLLLAHHGVEVDEVDVDGDLMQRLNRASLSQRDLDAVRIARPVRPSRLYDYETGARIARDKPSELYRNFPAAMRDMRGHACDG